MPFDVSTRLIRFSRRARSLKKWISHAVAMNCALLPDRNTHASKPSPAKRLNSVNFGLLQDKCAGFTHRGNLGMRCIGSHPAVAIDVRLAELKLR